jgi:hypothetical protein
MTPTAPIPDGPYKAALIEMLLALPALPPTWAPGTVQTAVRKAIDAYEKAKTP